MVTAWRNLRVRFAGWRWHTLSLESRAIAYVIFVSLLMIGLDGWRTLHDRAVQLRETVTTTANLAQTLTQQADDTFDAVDLAIAGQVERAIAGDTTPDKLERSRHFMADRVRQIPALHALAIYGADGNLVLAYPETAERNIAERPDFAFHRTNPAAPTMHLSPPRRLADGGWAITASRRIDDLDGNFQGMVAADITLSYFQNYYSTIDLGAQGVIAMMTTGGQMLARWPDAAGRVGHEIFSADELPNVHLSAITGVEGVSPVDGVNRITSARELAGYPVLVVVGLSKDEVLTEWRRNAVSNLIGVASLVAIIVLLGAPLARAIRTRGEAERTAAAAAAELKLLADNATDVIVQVDMKGACRFVSPGSRQVFGREPEEMLGMRIQSLVHPDDWPATRQALQSLVKDGDAVTIPHRMRHKAGHYVWVEAALRLLCDRQTGEPSEIISIMRDIRGRKEAEAFLLDAIESIHDGFVLYDINQRLVLCNKRYRSFYPRSGDLLVPGIERRQLLLGMAARGEFGRTGDPEIYIEEFLRTHVEGNTNFERGLSDGRWLLGADRRTSMGNWVGIRTDITEQKRRETDLEEVKERLESQAVELGRTADDLQALKDEAERARAEAERATQVKSEFLAMISHEIRTPMNGIIGMNALLLATPLTPDQFRFSEAVRLSAELLLTIINDILDVSKLEAGRVDLEIVDFDLAEVIEDAVALLSPRAQQKGLEIAADIAPEASARFRGDPTRLRQVMLNLLSNSIKFTEKGCVFVRVSADADTAGGTALRIEVHDTGIGIADETKARLFQPFQQGDSSITRRFGGTGLGLNICRQLAELMGGRIGVSDRSGGGSVFWIELTLAPGEASAATDPAVAEALHGLSVLVVDDTEINRFILSRQLTSAGMSVDEADDGSTALAAIEAASDAGHPFDIIVLDQVMPRLSGDLVAQAIRTQPGWHQPRIVLLSSAALPVRPGQQGTPAERGIDTILVKPVRRQVLIDTLARLAKPGAAAEPDTAPKESTAAPVERRSGYLLLAEDNFINQQVASALLEGAGYTVDVVGDGEAAVEALRERPYDLVLMDVQMPKMDGLEASRRLRTMPEGKSVPIIAMTANAMVDDRERCIEAGMDDYVSKPIEPHIMLETIAHWLTTRRIAEVPSHAPSAVEPEAESDAPVVIDEMHLANLRRLLSRDRFITLLNSFIETVDDRIDRLVQLAAERDLIGLYREAHDLVGSAGSLGARRLQLLGGTLQAACSDGDGEKAQRLVEEVRGAIVEAAALFNEMLVAVATA